MTEHRNDYSPDEPFPVDWNEWRKVWSAWRADFAETMGRTSFRFPGKNMLADEILGTWSINGRNVELSELTMPDFGVRPERRLRFVGITFGTGAGSDEPDNPVVATFHELEKELGLYVCMNCGTFRSVHGWTSCRDELGASCTRGTQVSVEDRDQ